MIPFPEKREEAHHVHGAKIARCPVVGSRRSPGQRFQPCGNPFLQRLRQQRVAPGLRHGQPAFHDNTLRFLVLAIAIFCLPIPAPKRQRKERTGCFRRLGALPGTGKHLPVGRAKLHDPAAQALRLFRRECVHLSGKRLVFGKALRRYGIEQQGSVEPGLYGGKRTPGRTARVKDLVQEPGGRLPRRRGKPAVEMRGGCQQDQQAVLPGKPERIQ